MAISQGNSIIFRMTRKFGRSRRVTQPQTSSTLKQDFKKILPVWLIIIVVAVVSVVLLKYFTHSIINYIQYPPRNPYLLAMAFKQEGIQHYREALKKAEDFREQGKMPNLENDSDVQRSTELFNKSLELFPAGEGINERLAVLAELRGDDVNAYYYQALALHESGNIEEAMARLNNALERDPQFVSAREKKTELFIQEKKFEEAHAEIKRLLEINQANPMAHYLAGTLALEEDKPDLAADHFSRALEHDTRFLKAARSLAGILQTKGRYKRALTILQNVEPYHPNEASLKHAIGKVYYNKGDYEKAYRYFLKAEDIETKSVPLYLDLARVSKKLGKRSLANVYIKNALDINPNLADEVLNELQQ